jgi:hypothetical protein
LFIVQENLEFLKSSLELSRLDKIILASVKLLENEQKLGHINKLVFSKGFSDVFNKLFA